MVHYTVIVFYTPGVHILNYLLFYIMNKTKTYVGEIIIYCTLNNTNECTYYAFTFIFKVFKRKI